MEYWLKIVQKKKGCRYLLSDAKGNYFVLRKLAWKILSRHSQNASYKSFTTQLKKECSGISEKLLKTLSTQSFFSTIKKIGTSFPSSKSLNQGRDVNVKIFKWLFCFIALPVFLTIDIITSPHLTSLSYYLENPLNIFDFE